MGCYEERPNYRLKALIIEVVENQMVENNPPITNKTFERLKKADTLNRKRRKR